MTPNCNLSLLTSREAALALGVADDHALAQQRHEGAGADYIKIGGEVRYDPYELDRYKRASRDKVLLTQDDVALWFGITKEVLYTLREGGLPSHEISSRVMFFRGEVEQFLRAQTRRPVLRPSVNVGRDGGAESNVTELRFVPLLTDRQAARLLNKSVGTLENWRSADRGPEYIKLGKAVRYDRGDVVRYISAVSDRTQLTLDEVGRLWRVSIDTVIRCIHMKNGPKTRRLNGKAIIYRGEAELFLRTLVRTPQPRRATAA